MREVKFIELILENCEVVKIPPQYVGIFNVNNLHHSISRMATNAILDAVSCDSLYLQISSKLVDPNSMWLEKDVLPIDRLTKCRDLVGVAVNYVDGTDEMIYVPWDDDPSEYTNSYETSRLNPYTGDLFIVVSKTENVSDIFVEQLGSKTSSCEFNDTAIQQEDESLILLGQAYLNSVVTKHPNIRVDEHFVGGKPSLAGGRIPVALVLTCLRDGMTQDEICTEYHLRSEQIKSALEYVVDVLERPFVEND